jgi:cytochrome bd-type quinol oxidase subunit 2
MVVLSLGNPARRDLVLILLITTIPVMPMILFGYHEGHDFDIHLESWMDAQAQFQQGILYPRWASEANYGFGEPRFIFYPPASWAFGGMLGMLLPWKIVPAIYVWLTMILAALAMRRLAADWLPPGAALAAALLYALNPYLMVSAYTRCAYPEIMASAVFPLLLWGALRIERNNRDAVAIIAITLAAIWIANLPAGVIATYALVCVLLTLSLLRRSLQPFLYGAAAGLIGFGLAAFSLFPAAWERKWVDIDAVIAPNQIPTSNFLFSPYGVGVIARFNHRLSPLALFLVLVAVTSAIAARRMRYLVPGVWWSLAALCGLSGFLMFPVSSPLWRALPAAKFVQFPWRWLFPMCTAAAILLVFAVVRSKRKRIVWPTLAFVLIVLDLGIIYAKQVYPNFTNVIAEKFQSGRGYPGLLEYTPLASKGRYLPADAPLLAPVEQQQLSGDGLAPYVEVWSAEKKVIHADLPHPTAFNLKLLAYPAWHATVNGKPVALQQSSQTGQLIVFLPAGPSRTEIIFARTWDRAVGTGISIASIVVLLAFWKPFPLSGKRPTDVTKFEDASAQGTPITLITAKEFKKIDKSIEKAQRE